MIASHPAPPLPTHGIGTALFVTLVRGGHAIPPTRGGHAVPQKLRHLRIIVHAPIPPIVG